MRWDASGCTSPDLQHRQPQNSQQHMPHSSLQMTASKSPCVYFLRIPRRIYLTNCFVTPVRQNTHAPQCCGGRLGAYLGDTPRQSTGGEERKGSVVKRR